MPARVLRAPSVTRYDSELLGRTILGKNLSLKVLRIVDSKFVRCPSFLRNSDICVVPRSFRNIFFRALNGSWLSSSVQKFLHEFVLSFLFYRWNSALILRDRMSLP